MRKLDHRIEFEKPRAALDRMKAAKDRIEQFAIVRRSLQADELLRHALDQIEAFVQKVGLELVVDFDGHVARIACIAVCVAAESEAEIREQGIGILLARRVRRRRPLEIESRLRRERRLMRLYRPPSAIL